MKLIGVTGRSGSGKSLVARMLTEYGAVHLDADLLAHQVYDTDKGLTDIIRREFGDGVCPDGTLDRQALGALVFGNPAALARLNAVSHPAITARIVEVIAQQRADGARAVVVDGAALIESGFDRGCDSVIAVTAPPAAMTERIMERDGLTPEQARARIAAQKPDSFYTEAAHITIHNDCTEGELRQKVAAAALAVLG